MCIKHAGSTQLMLLSRSCMFDAYRPVFPKIEPFWMAPSPGCPALALDALLFKSPFFLHAIAAPCCYCTQEEQGLEKQRVER